MSAGQKSRHINIRYFWIKDQTKELGIDARHCPTQLGYKIAYDSFYIRLKFHSACLYIKVLVLVQPVNLFSTFARLTLLNV